MRKGLVVKAAVALTAIAMMAAPALAGGKITITGSTTVLPVAQKAAEVFMNKHQGLNITVAGTGSGDGIKSIIDGTADIGDASRDMKKKEIKRAEDKGVTPVKHVVGLDCIVPIVNPSNQLRDLTLAQLKDIYTGKVKNWKEVGGADKPVVVISRDSSSGTFEVWNKKVLKKERVRPDAQLQASNGAVAQAVAGNKYAIGYVGIGYLNSKIKGLTVGGVQASAKTAMDKSYPVARALFMFTNGQPKGDVKAFLDFVKSDAGQKIVKEEGFVPFK
ncbi:phosphate ABC transporter substrate-binding protein [Dethiosulfatarculus sandiegensis]|uniref:Phosphate-binding protein n=1 Tax=Dethiosulfatarculus sandiegensis TaxID=1429043 RepID=A0A0D2J3E7_9BACT|nr:phosphate ABC transporter substrate-binding protein [Dethiosulfatarculus sandiegensis]KIX12719.1 phosphate ABC transporter substrate-binding protein [Dethiosulfatarculus sandiegensis]